MYVGQLTFARLRPVEREEAYEAIHNLLLAFKRNGQISGQEWAVASQEAEYVATMLLAERDALEAVHHNRYVREALQKLEKAGLSEPQCDVAEDLISERSCECAPPPSYILYTNFLTYAAPLRCGHCLLPVALYRVPSEDWQLKQDILWWEATYQAYDTLAMGSGPLEHAAMDQVSRFDSELSQKGIEICRCVYEATGVPTFYCLHQYAWGHASVEETPLCPSCQEEWLLPTPWRHFDMRCDRCHLLSNTALSFD